MSHVFKDGDHCWIMRDGKWRHGTLRIEAGPNGVRIYAEETKEETE